MLLQYGVSRRPSYLRLQGSSDCWACELLAPNAGNCAPVESRDDGVDVRSGSTKPGGRTAATIGRSEW